MSEIEDIFVNIIDMTDRINMLERQVEKLEKVLQVLINDIISPKPKIFVDEKIKDAKITVKGDPTTQIIIERQTTFTDYMQGQGD